ncbi:MAG: hypothetical protein F4Z59_04950 [Gemmatimonadales bacterium]|nr:hypothetical protein [Gemmatimonadales bacterium]
MAASAGSEGYRAAVERVGLFSDFRRAVVAVSGPGALRVLNGLASNDVKDVPVGRGVYSFFLDRRGRVVADLRLLPVAGFERDAGDAGTQTLWLDAPGDALPALMNHLRKYVPPMFAGHRETGVAVHALIGPRAAEALEHWEAGAGVSFVRRPGELAPLEATTVRIGGPLALVVCREEIEGAGFDLYVDHADGTRDAERLSSQLQRAVARSGGAAAVRGDWEILRLERGLPVFGSELGAERLAQEAGQDDRAISFAKGCFTGQEVVARIHYRGHVNRHLRGLRWTPNAHHQARDLVGAELRTPSETRGAKPVGLITSATRSPRFGPIGLGYVRREVAPGAVLESTDHPGVVLHVADLPFTQK